MMIARRNLARKAKEEKRLREERERKVKAVQVRR